MDYLALVQRTFKECGLAGSAPSAVSGQNAEVTRLIDWVDQTWEEIQLRREDWFFKRKDFTLNTVAGDSTYSASDASITDFGSWDVNDMSVYKTSIGRSDEGFLTEQTFSEWKRAFDIGVQTNNRPQFFCVDFNQDLRFGSIPDDDYTVRGFYFRTTQALANDSDEPDMPAEFHMAIVWGAVLQYGLFEAAQEIIARAQPKFDLFMNRLEQRGYIPTTGFPLA